MKKSLLVVAYLLIFANTAYSQDFGSDNFSTAPTINVGGFVNANAGFRSEDGSYKNIRLPDAQISSETKVNNATGSQNRMTNNPDFTNEAEIHIKVAGINEIGMKYGAVIELEANTSTAARNEGFNADKAFIFTESRFGKLEFGNNSAANHRMKVGPETFARGAGGINGKYLEYINLPMLADSTQVTAVGGTAIGNCNGYRVDSNGTVTETGTDCSKIKLPRFILIPESPIAHGGYAKGFYNRADDNDYSNTNTDASFGFNKNKTSSQVRDGQFGDLEDASKISYYTPRISGWQFGASFTPDTGNNGTSASITGDNSGDIKQAISFGVNYSDNFGNLGLAVSGTAENGKFEQAASATTKRNDLKAYDVGFMATYLGATIGASYGNWGNSLTPTTGIYSCNYDSTKSLDNQTCTNTSTTSGGQKFSDATYYTAGIAYQFGPAASSITYLSSNFQENTYTALSVGFDYRMAKGLMPYLEVTKYNFESNQAKYFDTSTSETIDQSTIDNNIRQLKDNSGYVVLAGFLFSF
jgi:hypothetical protein